jgi:hypothetical protein
MTKDKIKNKIQIEIINIIKTITIKKRDWIKIIERRVKYNLHAIQKKKRNEKKNELMSNQAEPRRTR